MVSRLRLGCQAHGQAGLSGQFWCAERYVLFASYEGVPTCGAPISFLFPVFVVFVVFVVFTLVFVALLLFDSLPLIGF